MVFIDGLTKWFLHIIITITSSLNANRYVWIKLPEELRCNGGRVRWWQPDSGSERGRYDWALDAVVVGGSVDPPHTLTYTEPHHLVPPLWLRRYNAHTGR